MQLSTILIVAIGCIFLGVGWADALDRRKRVVLLIAAFLGLHVFACGLPSLLYFASRFDRRIDRRFTVMPFRGYSLYSKPAPSKVLQAEAVMVDGDGVEYPIDFRIWEPLIPRYANVLLWESVWESSNFQQEMGKTLFNRLDTALKIRQATGRFDGFNSYLLGCCHYPEHQTPARQWNSQARLPSSHAIEAVRVYRVGWDKWKRRSTPSAYSRVLAYEYKR